MTVLGVKRIGLFGGPLPGRATLGLSQVLPPYAADVIFVFMGGFIIGLAIERWGLDRRLAFSILRLVGARPGAYVLKARVWLNLAGILVITAQVTLLSATFLSHVFGPQP